MIMSDKKKLIDELKAQIAKSKLLVQEQEKALQIVEDMLSSGAAEKYSDNETHKATDGHDELIKLDSPTNQPTLKDEVIAIIQKLGDQEFTVAQIESLLNKMGKIVTGTAPRSRISMILSKLTDEDGMLFRSFEGAGNIPNRYKIKKLETETGDFISSTELSSKNSTLEFN